MSKELTDKYYKGTLPTGCYYFDNGREIRPLMHHCIKDLTPLGKDTTVLCKVPDYQALQHLKRKLIQTKPELESWVIKHYGELER